MKLYGIKDTEDGITLRYKTTYRMSWFEVLDFSQVFLNDIAEKVSGAYYFLVAGAPLSNVDCIKGGLLHQTPEFAEERGGIVLIGVSKSLNAKLGLTVYNQLDIVDIHIYSGSAIIDEIASDNHILDKYISSIELNMIARGSQKYAIELFFHYLNDKDSKEAEKFKKLCHDLGVKPLTKAKQEQLVDVKCPACQAVVSFNESNIPSGETYDIQCPQCKMLIKRKKL